MESDPHDRCPYCGEEIYCPFCGDLLEDPVYGFSC